jgi:Ca-activated chloride channel homolog
MSRWPAALKLALALPFLAAQEQPVIRVDVKLVHVLATVKNSEGQLVGTLDQGDFEIYDNGARQRVAVFERQTAQPLNVALMVDTSGSTAKDLRYEQESVNRFFKAFFAEGNPADLIALYSFNWQVTREHYFTHSHAGLERAVRQLKAEAGTCL